MSRLLTFLALVALVLSVGCGSGDKADDGAAGCGNGDAVKNPPAGVTNKTVETPTTDVTYTCGCGKEKTVAADTPAPS